MQLRRYSPSIYFTLSIFAWTISNNIIQHYVHISIIQYHHNKRPASLTAPQHNASTEHTHKQLSHSISLFPGTQYRLRSYSWLYNNQNHPIPNTAYPSTLQQHRLPPAYYTTHSSPVSNNNISPRFSLAYYTNPGTTCTRPVHTALGNKQLT